MIISHKYNFVYIKTSKTASTSIEIALSSLLDKSAGDIATTLSPLDQEKRRQLKFQGPINHSAKRRILYFPHDSLQTLSSKKIWPSVNDYLIISSIRNPWDRFVSEYFWNQRKRPLPSLLEIGTGKFRRKLGGAIKGRIGMYDKPFSEFIFSRKKSIFNQVSVNGDVKVNFWIKFEKLSENMRELSCLLDSKLDLGESIKEIHTKYTFRGEQDYQKLYLANPGTIEHVENLCKDEISQFGYKF
jgi:hypothetical protein